MQRGKETIPAWAERERWADLAWILPHLEDFHMAAVIAFQELGRGAIVVDTDFRIEGGGHPVAYFTQNRVSRYDDPNFDRLITDYLPEEELVVILLKDSQRSIAYRLRAHSRTLSQA